VKRLGRWEMDAIDTTDAYQITIDARFQFSPLVHPDARLFR
jgi:hypothetical protein